MGVEIRQCTVSDKARLKQLNQYLKSKHDDAFWNSVTAHSDPNDNCLVAEDNQGSIQGYVVSRGHKPMTEYSIAVDENQRRKGIGSKLVHALSSKACDIEDFIELKVRENNTGAREFYKANNFQEVAVKPRHYGDGENAVIMRKTCR